MFNTGSRPAKKSQTEQDFETLVKPDTVKKCQEFSKTYISVYNNFGSQKNHKDLIKLKIQEIEKNETDNTDSLLKYLNHLIIENNNVELAIPYYQICQHTNHQIEPAIKLYEQYGFGTLGTIPEILSE